MPWEHQGDPNGQDLGPVGFVLRKASRHVHWARTEGLGRLIEEDRLDPRRRLASTARRIRWAAQHPARGHAVPVWVLGLQRSGTNMLLRSFEGAPNVDVLNENSRRAFRRYRLRLDDHLVRIVERSRHEFVVFKPLADSHRGVQLLEDVAPGPPGRAVWVHRDVVGRTRSSLSKFGDHDRRVVTSIVRGDGASLWQAQGLSAHAMQALQRFWSPDITPATGSALLWYARNEMVLSSGLAGRDDVLLTSYDRLLACPEVVWASICRFLGMPESPELVAHVAPRSLETPTTDPGIDDDVLVLCRGLQERLDAVQDGHRPAHART